MSLALAQQIRCPCRRKCHRTGGELATWQHPPSAHSANVQHQNRDNETTIRKGRVRSISPSNKDVYVPNIPPRAHAGSETSSHLAGLLRGTTQDTGSASSGKVRSAVSNQRQNEK